MKTFITKTFSLIFIFSLGVVAFVFLIHFIKKQNSNFTLHQKNDNLIFGHSHPECAFNDEILENFKNLSRSGESYFYTLQKIKEVIPTNDIDAVFIEYSNTVIIKEMDEWIWGYEKMNAYFPWHSISMNKEDLSLLYDKNPNDFPRAISTSTRNNLTKILTFDFNIDYRYGGYNKLAEGNIAKLIEEQKGDNSDSLRDYGISYENIKYLKKIVDYCESNDVKVYLVRSPQNKYFPRANEQKLLSLKNEKFGNLDFLDFDKFPLDDNKYGDLGHLNYKGAEIFSSWLDNLIKDGLLSKNNKTEFIYQEMEKLRLEKNLEVND